ncbi:hypothetical protein [Halegenticoccus tardaugens]|uniref:hypothetical protein n=1 Tax=Halegenticoccus tardaugens TaxID=2071624 RepID=UPI00100B8EEE|nr:hypothetical protein [Halegenticoccus tardaugens]
MSEAESAICGGGPINVGRIVGLMYGGLFLFFIFKAAPRAAFGIDKMGSTKSDTQMRGKEQAMGSVYSVGAAIVLFMIPLLLQAGGLDIASCLMP